MTPRATLHMKIDAGLKALLKKRAAAENRTLANLIETLLRKAVRK